jgi:hypothetical protein
MVFELDFRENSAGLLGLLSDLQRKHLPRATLRAVERTGRYVYGALRSEMEESFDRPTRWTMQAVQINRATADRPWFSVWINEDPNKGTPGVKYLSPQIEGGPRNHKRFERALILRGLMPQTAYAVPGKQAPLDQHGNVPVSFVVRVLSDLQAFGDRGYRKNRRGKRRGARRTNYFFVPALGSSLKPGVYWHMPNGLLGVAFAFVSRPAYARRYDFYGTADRAFHRVALRHMTEELERAVRGDNSRG